MCLVVPERKNSREKAKRERGRETGYAWYSSSSSDHLETKKEVKEEILGKRTEKRDREG